jgi:hypothetical protein
MHINLRGRYYEDSSTSIDNQPDYILTRLQCSYLIEHGSGSLILHKPRGWGKTFLCVDLMNLYNIGMITKSVKEEFRVRENYNINKLNQYHIFGYNYNHQLRGVSFKWWLIDDLDDDQFENLKYYMGFGLKNYIRIGTNGQN